MGKRSFLGSSMLTFCRHLKAKMRVAGTLSPFDWIEVTVMPTGSHERETGEIVRGRHAVCAMAIPVTAWKHMHFTIEYVGTSTKSPQCTHRVRTVCSTSSKCHQRAARDAARSAATVPYNMSVHHSIPCTTPQPVAPNPAKQSKHLKKGNPPPKERSGLTHSAITSLL